MLAPLPAQLAGKPASHKGPRALGLVQLLPNGSARLIPVTIMIDGKFYDASAYKADPVPMALEGGTVYEGVVSGVSQGLFTITAPLQGGDKWLAEGSWKPAGSEPRSKNSEVVAKAPDQDTDAPPILKRSAAPKPPESSPPPTPPQTVPPSSQPPVATSAPPEDQDAPVLKRGKPSPVSKQETPQPRKAATPPAAATKPATASIRLMAAISDAAGPEARPYTYELKAGEEAQFQKKLLVLAAEDVRARARALAGNSETSVSVKKPVRGKDPQPSFDDIQVHVFDLSSSNEPVWILSTVAQTPQASGASAEVKFFVTLVAREDIYGDLHRALVNVADSQHFDVLKRLELIDAVDADGDGRGELLFRQSSDAGTAFVVYRVIGDQLYALFEGAPQ